MYSLQKRLGAEFLGTLLLLAIVIGSGVMAENLSEGNNGIALIANTLATVFGLYILIEVFGPISGAHFNPVVTMVFALRKELETLGVTFSGHSDTDVAGYYQRGFANILCLVLLMQCGKYWALVGQFPFAQNENWRGSWRLGAGQSAVKMRRVGSTREGEKT